MASWAPGSWTASMRLKAATRAKLPGRSGGDSVSAQGSSTAGGGGGAVAPVRVEVDRQHLEGARQRRVVGAGRDQEPHDLGIEGRVDEPGELAPEEGCEVVDEDGHAVDDGVGAAAACAAQDALQDL